MNIQESPRLPKGAKIVMLARKTRTEDMYDRKQLLLAKKMFDKQLDRALKTGLRMKMV